MARKQRRGIGSKTFFDGLKSGEQDHYIEYLKNVHKHKHNNPTSIAMRRRYAVSVYPFGLHAADAATINNEANRYQVSITAQASAIADKFTLTGANRFGYKESLDSSNKKGQGFKPALMRITLYNPDTTPTNGTSAFTGREVKRYRSRSGSIPIGKIGEDFDGDYIERTAVLAAAVRGVSLTGEAIKTLSFENEYLQDFTSRGLQSLSDGKSEIPSISY